MKKWIHIIADLYDCDFDFYISKQNIENIVFDISQIIQINQLTIVWEKYYEFGKNSFTLVFLLAESHLSIHTWPEKKYISFDIYVCNY
jgi:S-adenosylmethionine decarboxylase proenzyme